MTSSPSSFDAFLKQFIQTLPPGLAEFKKDLEHHAKITLNHGLKELDLVTRQEFDTQRRVLQKTRRILDALNERLDTLERHQAPKRKPAAAKAQRKPAARQPSAHKPNNTQAQRKAPTGKSTTRPRPTRRKKT